MNISDCRSLDWVWTPACLFFMAHSLRSEFSRRAGSISKRLLLFCAKKYVTGSRWSLAKIDFGQSTSVHGNLLHRLLWHSVQLFYFTNICIIRGFSFPVQLFGYCCLEMSPQFGVSCHKWEKAQRKPWSNCKRRKWAWPSTFISLPVCSEPITEEGDGETEHLPSEDGQYSPDTTAHDSTTNLTTSILVYHEEIKWGNTLFWKKAN